MPSARGTTNSNQRGNTRDREARRIWLVTTYRANQDVRVVEIELDGQTFHTIEPCRHGLGEPACRCYRCGQLLTVETVTADRIIPGCKGGTYRRNNIRPACAACNSSTGGALARRSTRKAAA
jgi:hypothetical protein